MQKFKLFQNSDFNKNYHKLSLINYILIIYNVHFSEIVFNNF